MNLDKSTINILLHVIALSNGKVQNPLEIKDINTDKIVFNSIVCKNNEGIEGFYDTISEKFVSKDELVNMLSDIIHEDKFEQIPYQQVEYIEENNKYL